MWLFLFRCAKKQAPVIIIYFKTPYDKKKEGKTVCVFFLLFFAYKNTQKISDIWPQKLSSTVNRAILIKIGYNTIESGHILHHHNRQLHHPHRLRTIKIGYEYYTIKIDIKKRISLLHNHDHNHNKTKKRLKYYTLSRRTNRTAVYLQGRPTCPLRRITRVSCKASSTAVRISSFSSPEPTCTQAGT